MEICEELQLPLPEEYYFPIPPKLPKDFMVNLKQTERVKDCDSLDAGLLQKHLIMIILN